MRRLSVLPAAAALLACGCGYVGNPLPPLADVPARVAGLDVEQRGGRLLAAFTVPTATTEGIPFRKPPALDLRIGTAGVPFDEGRWAAEAKRVEPGKVEGGVAHYEIPAAEWTGKEAIVAVRLVGANGKQSGWSNFVVVPVVGPPEMPSAVSAEATPMGVRVFWKARGDRFRVLRRAGAEGEFAPAATVSTPEWTDAAAEFGKPYSYAVETLVRVAGNREAASEQSAPVSITPVDTFPPAAPAGLHAASAPHSVELAWDANSEPDLAGYRVYRAAPGGTLEKIGEPLVPAWSDAKVEPGKQYRYAVTAIDRKGNESPRSAEAVAALPE